RRVTKRLQIGSAVPTSARTALESSSPWGWAEIRHPFHPLRGRRFEVLKKRGTFADVGSVIGYRNIHTSTLLPDGTVLLAGGWSGAAVIASAEIYRPGIRIPSPALLSVSADGRGQ